MSNVQRMTTASQLLPLAFGFGISFDIRNWSFVIRISAPRSDLPQSPGGQGFRARRPLLGGFQYQIDGGRKAFPIGGLFEELLATGRSQFVELGLAIVLRSAPFRTDPSLLLQTIERRIKRALLHLQ